MVMPTKSRKSKKIFEVTIIKDRCKGCELCITNCPTDSLEMSKETNIKGYFVPRILDISTCSGCNLCSKLCPDFAIFCSEADVNKKDRKKSKKDKRKKS